MAWLILTIILAVIGTVGLLTGFSGSTPGTKIGGFATCGICILAWLILTVGLSVHSVGQRKAGIVYNFAGVIVGNRARDPGIVWTAPWQHIKTANVGLQREDFDLGPDNSAVSKDQQPIYANLSCNYQVSPTNIISLYKSVGPGWKDTLLDSRVLQDFKEITATFTAAEITTKRDDLRRETTQRVANEMKQYDITSVACFIKNLGYTPEYRAAVNAKNVQVQKALQAEAKVKQAQAEAQQIVAKAQGDAKANRLQSQSLTAPVLMQHAIDTLNGKVTVIYCVPGTICIPNADLSPFQAAIAGQNKKG